MSALYTLATSCIAPLLPFYLRLREKRGKEDGSRRHERLGKPRLPRPSGPLVWLHAASVGEAISILPLVEKIRTRYPSCNVMVTSVTVTSAALLAKRLPEGAFHQFMPVDTPGTTRRFIRHWQPDIALWVESEFWPNLIAAAKQSGCEMALLNARMSPRSFARWQKMPGLLQPMLSAFSLIFPQSAADHQRLEALGAHGLHSVGNLKDDAPPLGVDAQALKHLRGALANRVIWLAASTHPGEEEAIFAAHQTLKQRFPNLLTVLVPRHASRGNDLMLDIRAANLRAAQRSKGEMPDASCDVYLADTMGELGLFYRLCQVAFIGGSLVAHGGQNPLEAIRLGCAVVMGPHTFNFAAINADLQANKGFALVQDSKALAATLQPLLENTDMREQFVLRAQSALAARAGATEKIMHHLAPWLDNACAVSSPDLAIRNAPHANA